MGRESLGKASSGIDASWGQHQSREKTQIVNTLNKESFGFLGFDFRRVPKKGSHEYFILMTPKKSARKAVKAKVRDIIRNSGATPAKEVVSKINKVTHRLGELFSGRQLKPSV